jgi:porin
MLRGLKIGPIRVSGRSLGLSVAALLAVAVATPAAAEVDCGVSHRGIPDDAFFAIDPGGVRQALGRSGIEMGGAYVGEAFANNGGFNQGGKYDGLLQLHLNAHLEKMGFWKGLCFHTDGFQILGQSITADNIGSLMPVSNLEATPATRLFELWFEQHMFDDKLAVRFGQLAADAEFIIAEGGTFFLNGTWGWPSITASDLPSGGPAYPLATPGVRVAFTPNDNFQLLAGVYNGDPAPHCASNDPQVCNSNGLDFELNDPPLLMVEGAYNYNQSGPLPGTVKVGGWNHFGTFEHQRFDSGGALIAVTGDPGRPLDNDWGLYGRVIGAPSDRNLVAFYVDGGLTFSGMIPGRPDDAFAIGFAYTGISDQVRGFDVGFREPIDPDYEALLEICYTVQVANGWTLQPDFQYIWQPGGNVPNESGNAAVANAAVVGVRTTIGF